MAYMNNKQSLAKEQYQVNKSPSLNCISSTYLKNGEGDKVLDIYVAIDKKFAGTFQISDSIKEDSIYAINELKTKLNFKKVVMLTRR